MSEIQTPAVPVVTKKWYQKKLIMIPLILFIAFVVIGSTSKPATQPQLVSPAGVGQNQATAATQPVKTTFKAGDLIQANDNLTFTVTAADLAAKSTNEFVKPEAGKKFVKISLTLENKGTQKENVSTLLNFYLKNSEGEKGQQQLISNSSVDGELLAGDKNKGDIVYAIDEKSTGLKFYYNPSFIGGKTVVVEL